MTAPDTPAFAPHPVDAPAADPVAELHSAIANWREQQDAIAARMLAQPDHTLDALRVRLRPALAPIMRAFDGQRASAQAAATGLNRTITNRGLDEARATIAANRKAAVEAIVGPAREALDAAHAKTQQQIAAVGDTATADDRAAAADLAYELQPLTLANQLPLLTRVLRDAAVVGDIGRVAALLPLIRSLDERHPGAPGLTGLVTMTNAILATWQLQVARARLARIERMQWELGELTTAATAGGPDAELTLRLRGLEFADADGATAAPSPEPPAPRAIDAGDYALRHPVQRLRVTPEQWQRARALKKSAVDDE